MDLKEKVAKALRSHFQVEHLRPEDEDGIFGSVASPDFEALSSADRGTLLRRVVRDPSSNLTDCERRRIKLILMRTPAEYEAKLALDD